MYEFRMPSLGPDMESGTLVEWLKKPGDAVSRGDIVAVVETEKGAIEIEIFTAGVMQQWLAQEGAVVPVGKPLAMIATETPEEAPMAAPAPTPPPREVTGMPAPAQAPAPVSAKAPSRPVPLMPVAREAGGRIKASPAARAYARAHGIDLGTLTSERPGGAILRADVERMETAAPTAPPAAPVPLRKTKPGLDLDRMRHVIAAAMTRSKREIPHYYLSTQINVRAATQWLTGINSNRKPEDRLLLNALLLKAVAIAAQAYPRCNGFYEDGAFRQAGGVHIGAAIAIRGGGLVAPAIHDCNHKTLDELMTALRDLTGRVRQGAIRSSEISDPSLTVTALGERGVDAVFGVIYPPQVAIVGFGAPRLAPVAHADGGLVAEPVIATSLAADHRVTDGRYGAQFLSGIARALQEPEKL
jgi:pyruvate dehydrogenase E2 component (dihydrolipoamide acetyltransferase)